MASKPLTPVQLIDQASAEALNGSIILDLSSYGAPIRLSLAPSVATELGALLLQTSGEAIEQSNISAEIIQFPKRA